MGEATNALALQPGRDQLPLQNGALLQRVQGLQPKVSAEHLDDTRWQVGNRFREGWQVKLEEWQQKMALEKAKDVAAASMKAGCSIEDAVKAGERAFEEAYKAKAREASIKHVMGISGWGRKRAEREVDRYIASLEQK